MSFAAIPPAPARQAALTLHALSETDRNWLLQALPAEERDQLSSLLEELRTLGIPRDGALAAELEKLETTSAPPGDWLQSLDARGMAALACVLRSQPLEFTRAVLALAPAHVCQSIRVALQVSRDHTPPAARAVPPALASAICAALEPHWKAAMAGQATVKQPSRWIAWSSRIRRLGSGR